jgi:uncharacterized protein YfeS
MPWHVSSAKREPEMKIILSIGIVWAGICLIILWLNHRFPRHYVSKSDRQDFRLEVSVKAQKKKNAIQLISNDNVKIVSTNLRLSTKTGKITAPIGEVELESFQRPQMTKTIKKTPPGRDTEQERLDKE